MTMQRTGNRETLLGELARESVQHENIFSGSVTRLYHDIARTVYY